MSFQLKNLKFRRDLLPYVPTIHNWSKYVSFTSWYQLQYAGTVNLKYFTFIIMWSYRIYILVLALPRTSRESNSISLDSFLSRGRNHLATLHSHSVPTPSDLAGDYEAHSSKKLGTSKHLRYPIYWYTNIRTRNHQSIMSNTMQNFIWDSRLFISLKYSSRNYVVSR